MFPSQPEVGMIVWLQFNHETISKSRSAGLYPVIQFHPASFTAGLKKAHLTLKKNNTAKRLNRWCLFSLDHYTPLTTHLGGSPYSRTRFTFS